jgi:hypothetical protein
MLFARAANNIVDLDIFHQMSLIREALRLGHIPTTDLFSYAPTLPYFLHHEWGSGVIALFVASWFGAPGILLLKYTLIGFLGWLCVKVAQCRDPDPLPALAILAPLAILFVGDAFSTIRAHLYSLVFVASLLYFLELARKGRRFWIAIWLPLCVVWLNLHGGYALGIVFVGAHCFERMLRRERWLHLAALVAGMAAVAIVNPYGINYYRYLFEALRMSRPGIAEWMSPLQPAFSFFADAFLLSLVPILYALWKRGPLALPGLAILAVICLEGALHRRMDPFYAVVWVCYVPGYLLPTPFGIKLKSLFQRSLLAIEVAWLIAALFFLELAITMHPWELLVPGEGSVRDVVYPAGAVDYLAANRFTGNVMVQFEYGAFVTWKLYPAALVSLDSRYEAAYPNWWVAEVQRFYDAQPGWKTTLSSLPTDVVLVQRAQPLSAVIKATNWRRVYIDRSYEVYARPGLALPAVDFHDQAFPGRFP